VIAILKTVNPATLNFAQAVLKEADIPFFVMDQNVSIIEGSIGVIPRRVMVVDEDAKDARQAMVDAGLGDELERSKSLKSCAFLIGSTQIKQAPFLWQKHHQNHSPFRASS